MLDGVWIVRRRGRLGHIAGELAGAVEGGIV